MSSAPPRVRVYVIVHFERDGKRRVLLGREAVLHGTALNDMRTELNQDNANARSQRSYLRKLINEHQRIVYDDGKLKAKGPWHRGRNFGGVLLIGRLSLAGGMVEDNEDERVAAIRECVEELRLPAALLGNSEARALLQLVHEHRTDAPAEIRRYFSLDLDALAEQTPDLALDPADLVAGFANRAAFGHDGKEKVELEDIELSECIARMDGGLADTERDFMMRELETLAAEVCRIVGVTANEAQTTLRDNLFEFQEKRSVAPQVEALKTFRDH